MFIKLIQHKMKKIPMDTDIKIHMAPPLCLLTIVNIVRENNKVVLENENVQDIIYDDKPDIVGISVTVDTLPQAVEISKKFRKNGSVVVAGGIHITTAFETVPQNCFDCLCIGAAEGTWPYILKDYEEGNLKSVYRCKNKISGDDIISPAYDFLEKDKYLYCNVVHTSRGCPFKCDFCYNSASERMYINRNIKDVIKDIETIKSKHIMFIDDNFAGNIKWTEEFLKTIKPMDISPIITHHFDIKDYEKAIKSIHERGIMINASFVFGLDGDTKETFKATLDWIVKNKIETVTSHILTPYPGTALYDRLKKEGRIVTDDLSLYNTAEVVFKPKNMSAEEVYNGYIWLYKEVYSLKNIFKRMPESKNQIVPYFMFNLLYRKYGMFTDFLCKLISYKRIGIIAQKVSRYLK